MQKQTEDFLYWFSNYTGQAKSVQVAGAVLNPELRRLLKIDGNYGKFHGVTIEIVPSYKVVS